MAEHPVACDTWQPAIAGWLVAQIDPDEEAGLDAHLATCATCRSEAASLLAVSAVSLGADPSGPLVPAVADPPPDLRERTLGRVRRERRRRQAGRIALLVGATAVAVIVAVGRPDRPPDLQGEPVAFAVLPPGADASAVVARDDGGSVVQLTATGLDPAVTYALWLTPVGGGYAERVPAGTFRPDADGDVDARLHSALPAEDMARVWATTHDGDVALDTERH